MRIRGARIFRGTLLALAIYSCGNNASPLPHLFRHQLGELQNESRWCIKLGFVLGFVLTFVLGENISVGDVVRAEGLKT